MKGLIRSLSRAAETVAVLMLIAVTGLITAQIVAREVFVDGAPWADELARWCGLGLIFLAIPALLLQNAHVRVDMLLNLMPARLRQRMDVLNEALTVGFCLLYLVSGWQFLQRAGRFSSPALGIPNLLYYLPAALGMALMLLVAIDRLVDALRGQGATGNDKAGPGPGHGA